MNSMQKCCIHQKEQKKNNAVNNLEDNLQWKTIQQC